MIKYKWLMYAAVGTGGFVAGRMLKQETVRKAVKAGVREGLRVKQEIRRIVSEVREEVEDIAAEAEAELAHQHDECASQDKANDEVA